MASPLRVLALGHEASRSGAPLIHLGWLRWAAAHPERFVVHSVLVRRGPLLAEWPELRSLTLLSRMEGRSGLVRWLSQRLIDRPFILRRRFRRVWARLAAEGIDVVLVNSQAAGWLVPAFGEHHPPVVLHSHELASYSRRFVRREDRELLRQHVSRFVAVSEAGRRHLADDWGIKADQVSVVRNFVLGRPHLAVGRAEARRQLAADNGLPADVAWVIAVGALDPVKGPEVYIEVAARVVRARPYGVCFIWIGGGVGLPYGRSLRVLPGASEVRFLGARTDVASWLEAADMMLLTSVEESASLVLLEAGQVGTPVIAFRGTGGSDEMLDGGAGMLVAERSAQAMSIAVLRWLDHPEEADRAAVLARARVLTDADYERQCEALASILERVSREDIR